MNTKLSHLAVAVKDLNHARGFFELITGNPSSDPHLVESQKVNTSFISIGDTHIELLEPSEEITPITKFIENKGGGIHHLCIETDDFDSLIDKIKNENIRTLGEPSIGAKGKRVIFFHPKDTFGVLIELEEQ